MAGYERFVEVLHLFDKPKSNWTIQEIADAVGVPSSTIYRTVRDLVEHGFLEPSAEAHYRLGPAFIEFDRRVRLTDPLIKTGFTYIDDLVATARIPCVAILARLYGTRVICVTSLQAPGANVPTSYERGRPMPLLKGATSKSILAKLPTRLLRRLIVTAGNEAADVTVESLRHDLSVIRKRGYCVTRGEVDRGLVGIAAPIVRHDLAITASMSLIVRNDDLDYETERRLTMLIVSTSVILGTNM